MSVNKQGTLPDNEYNIVRDANGVTEIKAKSSSLMFCKSRLVETSPCFCLQAFSTICKLF